MHKLPTVRYRNAVAQNRNTETPLLKISNNKHYGKNAVNNDLKVGDKVLLKQNESNKMSTVYRKDPFIITQRKENCVTVQNDDVCHKRNIKHVKKFNLCTNVCNYSRTHGGETHNSDSTRDHVNSDSEKNVENDVNAKCLSP